MKVLLLSHSDRHGGAAIAASRLLEALVRNGDDARMLVERRLGGHPFVHRLPMSHRALKFAWRRLRERWIDSRHPGRRRDVLFSSVLGPDGLLHALRGFRPDVVHVHWTGPAFLNPKTLYRLGVPVVWTLHDMLPLTGGCHVESECRRYRDRCGACPVLGSAREGDISRAEWLRKRRAYQRAPLTALAPSRWLAGVAGESSLLGDVETRVIANALDLERFKPQPKRLAREVFGLPLSKRLVLFGGNRGMDDPNKGFRFLLEALRRLRESGGADEVELVVTGQAGSANRLGLPTHFVGDLSDEVAVSLLYSAADLFVVPSLAENLPNSIVEALACGTPIVASGVGGIPEIVEHEREGWLARAGDPESLAEGIRWVLGRLRPGTPLASRGRQRVVEAAQAAAVARQHQAHYVEQLELARTRQKSASLPVPS